ncbi:MAG: glycosyltransferase family 2 protein [Desulfohalobiaceae bacterium]
MKSFQQPDISVVVPVYGCVECLQDLYRRVAQVMACLGLEFELLLVDDRGPGRPWEKIKDLAGRDSRVRGIRLSRNFGQHFAISAGIDFCTGKWLTVMDCDLQDLPEELPKLWHKAQEGYDIVLARRWERQDGWAKRLCSKLFHKLWSYMTEEASDAAQANFGLYSEQVVEELKRLPEKARVFPLLVRWLGFETISVDVDHAKREHGKSSYSWKKLFSLAADGIVSYSNKPLKLFVLLGFCISALSFCFGLWVIGRYLLYPGQTLMGWSSIMVSMYFLAGLLLFGLGILGVYVGRIFNQVKGRPLYVVKEVAQQPIVEQSSRR